MAKRDYFFIADTETTQPKGGENPIPAKVADFGGVVCDRQGNIYTSIAVMVAGVYNNPDTPLFFTSDPDGIWSKAGQGKRYNMYNMMLENGERMLSSVQAINNWLLKVKERYDPYLTAYNLAFDSEKCDNTDIRLDIFKKRFCLWHASQEKWGHSKKYRQFVLDNHIFRSPTDLGNMSYRTNAEAMCRFVLNDPDMPDEPHTALEDARDYEMPILTKLVQTTKKEKWLNPKPYNWRNYQVKDWYKPA